MNGYLFAGYSAILVLIGVYLGYQHYRLGRLSRELAHLREELGADEGRELSGEG